ncbi:hypothetical protein GIB67_014789 [Kingdonia uniflora]|uniref:Protein kinase domain-containing protein n=1 Tax=Kingdonia uniflora TaxID=39325 RepID=A0A7J7NVF2_9MAGN|nr:hypothetical protein GIB67_014789 [Kingdonia uniflora]
MLGENPKLSVFTIGKLTIATNNFTFDNKLGEGGFGLVYKGKFFDGQEIAVKRLSKGSGRDERSLRMKLSLFLNFNT